MLSSFTDGFFSVDPKHGFLPIAEPLAKLPETFSGLQSLIDEMPIVKDDGSPGLLATEGAFEKAVLALPNYLSEVQSEKDPFVLAALFRAYGFVTSAYTLAPSHIIAF
jgi:indoleamine 2,3-dioxygenase